MTEEEAIHLFALRLAHKLFHSFQSPPRDLWQALYDAIRADLERYERERKP